jgi:hypothetical protein
VPLKRSSMPACLALLLLAPSAWAQGYAASADAPPVAALAAAPDEVPLPENVVTDPPLMGYRDGLYLRDERDNFRLYPQAQVDIDARGAVGAEGLSEAQGAVLGRPQLALRRARLALAGDLFKHYNWRVASEVYGAPRLDANGLAESRGSCTGSARERAPGRDAARTDLCVRLTDAWLNIDFLPALQLLVGQLRMPFSMENNTDSSAMPASERSVAVRGFVVPNGEDVGAALWGSSKYRYLHYAVGLFGGDGPNRSAVDGRVDVVGRVFFRPLNTRGPEFPRVQVGLNGRYGQRDPRGVTDELAPVTSGQGFALWNPGYVDGLGRETRVHQSGDDVALGLEWRVPEGPFAVQGEAYFVYRETREAIRGYAASNTERLGALIGGAGYVQASVWVGDWFVAGDPGLGARPTDVYLYLPPHSKRVGFEFALRASGIFAKYEPNSRGGASPVCPRTGIVGGCSGTDLQILELTTSATFWKERAFRWGLEANMYVTPGAGTGENLGGTPGSLVSGKDGAEVFAELSSRFGVTF